MATDGVGVISADGKTVLRRSGGQLDIVGMRKRPVIIDTCTNVHCTR